MTLEQEAQEHLSKEAQRIARLIRDALVSQDLPGTRFVDALPDYYNDLWRAIGRELYNYDETRPDFFFFQVIAGWVKALAGCGVAEFYDELAARERASQHDGDAAAPDDGKTRD
jgi:hypothetical protein